MEIDNKEVSEVCVSCGGLNDRKEQNFETCSACEVGSAETS